jgi:hypothetical protein
VAAAASGAEHTSDAIALVFSRAAIRVCIAWTIGFVVLTAAWFTIGQTVMDQTVMDQTVMEQTTIESPTVKTTISSFPANFTDQWSKMILISIASGLVSFAALLLGNRQVCRERQISADRHRDHWRIGCIGNSFHWHRCTVRCVPLSLWRSRVSVGRFFGDRLVRFAHDGRSSAVGQRLDGTGSASQRVIKQPTETSSTDKYSNHNA